MLARFFSDDEDNDDDDDDTLSALRTIELFRPTLVATRASVLHLS